MTLFSLSLSRCPSFRFLSTSRVVQVWACICYDGIPRESKCAQLHDDIRSSGIFLYTMYIGVYVSLCFSWFRFWRFSSAYIRHIYFAMNVAISLMCGNKFCWRLVALLLILLFACIVSDRRQCVPTTAALNKNQYWPEKWPRLRNRSNRASGAWRTGIIALLYRMTVYVFVELACLIANSHTQAMHNWRKSVQMRTAFGAYRAVCITCTILNFGVSSKNALQIAYSILFDNCFWLTTAYGRRILYQNVAANGLRFALM